MGRVSDAAGKLATYIVGTVFAVALVLLYTQLGVTPLSLVIALNIALFLAITARMVSSQALSSAIPEPQDRGAYMSISSSLQQFAGGIASSAAGLIVSQTNDGPLQHYDRLGYVVGGAMIATVFFVYKMNRLVLGSARPPAPLTTGVAIATDSPHG